MSREHSQAHALHAVFTKASGPPIASLQLSATVVVVTVTVVAIAITVTVTVIVFTTANTAVDCHFAVPASAERLKRRVVRYACHLGHDLHHAPQDAQQVVDAEAVLRHRQLRQLQPLMNELPTGAAFPSRPTPGQRYHEQLNSTVATCVACDSVELHRQAGM